MKTGRTIEELAAEIVRRETAKKDFVAATSAMTMTPREDAIMEQTPRKANGGAEEWLMPQPMTLTLDGNGHGRETFPIRSHTHGQIAAWSKIPKPYYDRLRVQAPGLLASNVNEWLRRSPDRRMLRTLDGNARAFLSDRYRRLDNEDVMEAILPRLMEAPDLRIVSCEVTERRLYIKALFPKIEGEVRQGDPVQSGIVISNSEIGLGSLAVEPLIFRLICLNGMIAKASGIRRHHVGRRIDGEAFELYRDETVEADDKALLMKLQDTVAAALKPEGFEKILARLRETTAGEQIANPIPAVEVMAKTFGLREAEKTSVLTNLLQSGDLSRWGALNAVTQVANDSSDYDRATEIEAMGGTILDLPASQWSTIATAETKTEATGEYIDADV